MNHPPGPIYKRLFGDPQALTPAQQSILDSIPMQDARAAADALAAQPAAEPCRVNELWSGVCVLGTKGCDLQHAPIDMVLYCPACGVQHIDGPEVTIDKCIYSEPDWDNPPHRSHLCHNCGHNWRPADVPTNGVAAVKTKGKNDSPIAQPARAGGDAPSLAGALARLEAANNSLCAMRTRSQYLDMIDSGQSDALAELDAARAEARAALAAAPQPAAITVPPAWLSDQYSGEFDDMTPGQAFRKGWNDCRAAMLSAPQPAPAEHLSEDIEAMAVARYKVVHAHSSMFWSHAVVAGDGQQQLYIGRELECRNMAAKFAGAFLDGAFVAKQPAPAERPSPELAWLYSHCKAIGMTKKSDSGKWEHDIALFTIDLRQQAAEARQQPAGGAVPSAVERDACTDSQRLGFVLEHLLGKRDLAALVSIAHDEDGFRLSDDEVLQGIDAAIRGIGSSKEGGAA